MEEEDIKRVKTSIKEHGYKIKYELELPVNHGVLVRKDKESYFIKARCQDNGFDVSQTEIDAYKYLSKGTARIPTFIEHWIINGNPDIYITVFKVVNGGSLRSYANKDMGEKWWDKIMGQIISFITFLESNRINHNDLHDNNIIVTGENNDELVFIDFEFMHQYNKNPAISSPVIMNCNKKKKEIEYMKDCGFVKRFVRGKDLNLILGCIYHGHKYLPDKWKKRINKYLKTRVNSDGERTHRIIKSNLNPFP
jgi:serine/threonine protein kinase